MTEEQKYNELMKQSARRENKLIKQLQQEYKTAYDETVAEIELYHRKYAKDGKFEYEEMVKYNRLKALNAEIGKMIGKLYNSVNKDIDAELGENFLDAYQYTGFILETEAQAKLNFMVLPKEQVEASIQNPLSGLTFDETIEKNVFMLKSRVRQTLTQSIIRGLDMTKTAKRIQYDLGVGFNNAVRIARTEMTRTRNAGQEQAYEKAKSLGIKFDKIWLATLDNRTRDTHKRLDGQLADNEGFFTVNGNKALYPGGFGVASLDINCRCSTRTNISDPLYRKDNITKDIIPYQTYTEWEKNRLKDKT